ncbi:uncharacterized protein LOC134248303 [Saccostrea cucullata]|uniref:uncharacterized protein LOC134248303 n=1 Tax=Saccostrea cuccullata TaxID=36930 RepID=UPI002ED5BA8A
MGTEEDKEERTRKLTEKGSGQYSERNSFYRNKTEKAWDDVQKVLVNLYEVDGSTVDIMESDLRKHYDHYVSVCSDYIEFLKGTRTDESDNELCLLEKTLSNCGRMFKSALTQIKIIRNADAKSIANTTADSSASRETKVQIKLEKIKAKVKLAEEEAGIQKQLAEIRHTREEEKLKAELNVISLKKEAIELEAEARASSIGEDRDNSPPPPMRLPMEKSRTERYVAEHFHNPIVHPLHYGPSNSPYIKSDPCDRDPFCRHTPNNDNSVASELTSFLLKKDLLMTTISTILISHSQLTHPNQIPFHTRLETRNLSSLERQM